MRFKVKVLVKAEYEIETTDYDLEHNGALEAMAEEWRFLSTEPETGYLLEAVQIAAESGTLTPLKIERA